MNDTDIQITIGEQVISATLRDNSAARSLLSQLPLTLTLTDFNAAEKTGQLPEALDMSGMPAGDEPQIDDIGYYAPNQVLVLYYGHVGFWNGIARLGRFEANPAVIEKLADGTTATINLTR